jgi:hypothetical protein
MEILLRCLANRWTIIPAAKIEHARPARISIFKERVARQCFLGVFEDKYSVSLLKHINFLASL